MSGDFRIAVKGERFEELRRWFIGRLPATRGFEGNVSVEVVRDQDGPARVVFLEKWDSRENFEAYLAWRDETGLVAELLGLIEGGIDFRFHDAIGV